MKEFKTCRDAFPQCLFDAILKYGVGGLQDFRRFVVRERDSAVLVQYAQTVTDLGENIGEVRRRHTAL